MSRHKTVQRPVVLVDDEQSVLLSTRLLLESSGIRPVETLNDPKRLIPFISEHGASLIVLDLMMPELPGVKLLPELVRNHPQIPVIVMSAVQDLDTAVRCMKEGAFDYLIKPVEKSRLISSIGRALEIRKLQDEVQTLKGVLLDDDLHDADAFSSIITRSKKVLALFHYIRAIAHSPEPVLVTGETGVGKEMIAQSIHTMNEAPGPLISLNVAGLDETAFTDTLFGHRRGAFTGADKDREGMIAQARNGTLFLDEIGDIPVGLQLKLLRLLQEKRYYPLGSDTLRHANTRFIFATNKSLEQAMEKGSFRPDLYYRLSSHHIAIPPLRERPEDIQPLVLHFVAESAEALGTEPPSVPHALFSLLERLPFPGNIRELRGLIYDAVARNEGDTLSMHPFQELATRAGLLTMETSKGSGINHFTDFPDPLPTLNEAEAHLIEETLRRCGGNRTMAAKRLGTTRQTLNRKKRALRR
ncbi:MAG: sigma-54-dependent Fis family transcriptional regulator [Magnetococcales bacterium]|nr:sigma-54-dependent Fis family transcriptional regulator [Magnetococcales bacterium]